MRLSCQKALLFALISTIGCDTATATAPAGLTTHYQLRAINGRQLPTYLAPTPGSTATIVSSSLFLSTDGKAVMVERRQDIVLGEGTYMNSFDYRIDGNQIEIGSFEPCPSNAICAANRIGTFSSAGLSLVISPGPDNLIVYEYRNISPD